MLTEPLEPPSIPPLEDDPLDALLLPQARLSGTASRTTPQSLLDTNYFKSDLLSHYEWIRPTLKTGRNTLKLVHTPSGHAVNGLYFAIQDRMNYWRCVIEIVDYDPVNVISHGYNPVNKIKSFSLQIELINDKEQILKSLLPQLQKAWTYLCEEQPLETLDNQITIECIENLLIIYEEYQLYREPTPNHSTTTRLSDVVVSDPTINPLHIHPAHTLDTQSIPPTAPQHPQSNLQMSRIFEPSGTLSVAAPSKMHARPNRDSSASEPDDEIPAAPASQRRRTDLPHALPHSIIDTSSATPPACIPVSSLILATNKTPLPIFPASAPEGTPMADFDWEVGSHHDDDRVFQGFTPPATPSADTSLHPMDLFGNIPAISMSPMPAVTGPRTAHTFTAAPVSVSSISPSPEPTHSASSTTLAPQTTPGIEGFDGSDLLDGTPLDDATPKPAPEWTEWGDGYDY